MYSIFIIPPEPIFSQLKNKIDELAKQFNGPVFEPHMTLVGNIEMDLAELEQKVKELAGNTSKFEVKTSEVSFSTTYFQNVFVKVKPSARLMQLNLNAKKLLGMENNLFMPHISLLYGTQDMERREKAAFQIELPELSFEARELAIVPASEDMSKWIPVSKIPLI